MLYIDNSTLVFLRFEEIKEKKHNITKNKDNTRQFIVHSRPFDFRINVILHDFTPHVIYRFKTKNTALTI